MVTKALKIFGLLTFAGMITVTSGCKCICKENRQAGLATILCQPMDVEVTNKDQVVDFEVKVIGREVTYQWYFNDERLTEGGKEGREFEGVNDARLIIPKFTMNRIGFYRCEIDSVDCLGMPLRTTTRSASLGTALMLKAPAPPTQPLPAPGSPKTNQCGSNFCASVSFRNGTTGYIPPATVPPGNAAPTKCLLTVTANGVVQPVSAYDVQVNDKTLTPYCAGNEDGQTKSFAVTPGTHVYRFTVYFKCPSPPKGTQIGLAVKWQ